MSGSRIYASSGFFRVFGISLALGRTFEPEADHTSGIRQVIISDSYWRERLQSSPSVIGSTIEIDTFRGGKLTIVGVMPAAFDFPHGVKIWLSLADWGGGPMPARDDANRCCAWYATFARLKAGVSIGQAAHKLTSISLDLSQRYPAMSRVSAVKVEPLRETLAGSYRLSLFTIFGAAGCPLLIAWR